MKATELMIGDWVKTTSDWPERYQNKITRVRGLCDENGQIDCDLTEPNGAYVWSDDEDSFEPIPLSKEILKKNGFDCSDKEIIHLYFEDGDYKGYFALRAMYEKETGIQKGWGFLAFNVIVVLDYVHELQHALRLCGIDKEIVL